MQCRIPGFDPWVRKIPWRRAQKPTPIFLPGELHGQRSLSGYSPSGRKELDTTESHTITHTISTYPEKSGGIMAFKVGSSKMCSDLQFCSSPCSSFSSIGLTLSLVPLAAPNTACQHSHLSGDGENLTSRGSFFQVRMFSQKPSAKLSLARSGSHANLQINLWPGRGRRKQET